jgi:predicted HicB family RNase H-like nuclease
MLTKVVPEKELYNLYTYRVTWSQEDNEFVGLCAEFPSLSWLDANQWDALKGINKVVADVVSDMKSNGEQIPKPLALREYRGIFTVRIPPELHRKLAIQAAEYGISVNRLISTKLAVY